MGKVIIEPCLFKCLLCKKFIHLPTVINECLHRFCKLCITNYFEINTNKTCPECQIILINPLQTLRSDLTFQRLLYKIFPHQSINADIQKINVYLEHWDISLDLFPNESSVLLSKCYLECLAHTPLFAIEKFLRSKYSLGSTLKIDLFYKSFLLNTENERLIDVCYCFDMINKSPTLDIRFIVSPYGYKPILNRIRQSKESVVSPPINDLSLSSTSSIDSKLKVTICRSQSSTNDWYISQSKSSNQLPDLVNSCENSSKRKRLKPRRRIRFIPTMVQIPASIFDREYDVINTEVKQTLPICKVPPCIQDDLSLFDNIPIDLSLK